MNKRLLGKTGIKVSEISFGGVEIGLPYGAHKQLMSEDDAFDLLRAAEKGGINFFDTARMYGLSEERIGKAFKGNREKIVICTKCPHLRDENKQIRTGSLLKSFVEDSLKTSLKSLQTDYADVYMCHSGDTEILKSDEIADLFVRLKQYGCTRSIGVSTYGASDTEMAIKDGRWDVIELAFNLMDQSCGELFSLAKQRGVGIIVRSVLMRGILTDAGIELSHERLKPVFERRKKFLELSKTSNESLSDFATRFVLSFEDISSALIGIDKPEFLEKALELANGSYLDCELLSRAKKLAYPDPAFMNIGMWDRKGWT